jgi:hypothetical protein
METGLGGKVGRSSRVFLASALPTHITGTTIAIDGGMTRTI